MEVALNPHAERLDADKHRPCAKAHGFTLIELLVVIGIIALLMALVGIVAWKQREKSRIVRTKALIQRIHMAMDAYKAYERCYPPEAKDEWPTPYSDIGVALPSRWLTQAEAAHKFDVVDLDPADPNYFVDAWGSQIRFRKMGRETMLIWSVGPDKTDAIGLTKNSRAGDDISHMDVGH
jgi:prepilin-type N-terminal cleavage/methylation domain-containing protein